MNVKEASEYACVCENVIRSWITADLLPHYRLGVAGKRGKIVIMQEDLDGVLASFKVSRRVPEPVKAPVARKPILRHLKLKPS